MAGHLYITWKKIPFLRLLVALISGILMQWYIQLQPGSWYLIAIGAALLRIVIPNFNLFQRYKLSFLTGMATLFLFTALGGLLTYQKDIRNHNDWIGRYYSENDIVLAVLQEPLIERTKTFKAVATVTCIQNDGQVLPVKGKIILYFRKQLEVGTPDSSYDKLGYGSQIIFRQNLQSIRNTGNPGGFDYMRYCIFQGLTHQVFLKGGQFELLHDKLEKAFPQFLFETRERIVGWLQKYIPGEKVRGLAEALLIGYKNDLDRSLIQSYANTGVVHIIAISGLHLGLIYWLLVLLCNPLKKKKKLNWLVPVIIISSLWLFSFLAGAQPSILRSAIMFTCIVLAENIYRKTSVYNTLACSAFILLCINPFWLWDAGFQLSYAAIVGILIFSRSISNMFYIPNKFLDNAWRLNAVTLAAQVFTIPVSIYHFHQFPNYFFIANLIAVPLSSIILLMEILLCAIAAIPSFAFVLGKIIAWLIRLMNQVVEKIESWPGSVWQGMQINLAQAIILTAILAFIGYWLLERSKRAFISTIALILGFLILRSHSFIEARSQRKIIFYNIPQKNAIEFIEGRNCVFHGDSAILSDEYIMNFHLRPAHTRLRVNNISPIKGLHVNDNFISFSGKHLLMIDEKLMLRKVENRPIIDYLVLSGNPKLYMNSLAVSLNIRKIIFAGSVPAWKCRDWKKECDSLRIPWHDLTQDGAFVVRVR